MSDIVNNMETTATVEVGNTGYIGNIEESYDIDWIKVDLINGTDYTINLIGSNTNSTALGDTYIDGIYDSNGNLISGTSNDDYNGLNSRVFFTADNTDIYYIAVKGYDSNTGEYTLSVDEGTDTSYSYEDNYYDEPSYSNGETNTTYDDSISDDVNTTASVIVDSENGYTGSIDGNRDIDWIKVDNLTQNTGYEINLQATSTSNLDTVIEGVYDSDGTLLSGTYNDDGGNGLNSQLDFVAPSDGTFYIAARGFYSNSVGDYNLTVSNVGAIVDDHTDSIDGEFDSTNQFSGITTDMQTLTGEIERSQDQDLFKMNTVSGETYEITVNATSNYFWPSVDILDSNGNYLWDNVEWINNDNYYDEESNNHEVAHMLFTAEISTENFIKIQGWEDGSYNVNINTFTIEADDHANSIAQINADNDSILVGNTIEAQLETSSDRDYFAVELNTGKEYSIALDSDDNNFYPYFELLDGDGNYIGDTSWEYDDNSIERRVFTPTEDGTYYIDVDGYSTGAYSISVNELSDDHSNSVDGDFDETDTFNIVLNENATLEGSIERAYDIDMFQLNTLANSSYEITVSSEDDIWADVSIKDKDGYSVWDNIDWSWSYDENNVASLTFTPSDTNQYFIKVNGYDTGDYQVSVTSNEIAPDDHTDTVDGIFDATNIFENIDSTGASLSGIIDSSRDNDLFKLSAEAGTVYEIGFDNVSNGTEPYLDILDSDGYYLYSDVYWDWNEDTNTSTLQFSAPNNDNYYIRVSSWQTSEYSLNVKNVTANDDHTNLVTGTFDATNTFDINAAQNTTLTGELETSYDRDLFKLVTTDDSVYEITLSNTDSNSFSPYMDILNENGDYVWEGVQWDYNYDYSSNELDKIVFTPSQAGTFFIQIDGWESGSYSIDVNEIEIEQDDHGNSISSATHLNIGDSINAGLQSNQDMDYFSFSATSGQIYEVTLDSNDGSPYIDLYDENGDYLWENVSWDWDENSQKVYIFADSNEEIYVKIDSWQQIENYTLSVDSITVENDDRVNTIEEARETESIVLDTDINASLETSFDTDFFKFDVQADTSYTITLDTNDDSWPYLNIYDAQGNYVWENINWDWDPEYSTILTYTPTQSDSYFIQVDGWESSDYTLKVATTTSTIEDDYTNNVSTTALVNVNDTNGLDANIDNYNDHDWLKISLEENQVYTINVTSDEIDTVIDGVYNSNGEYISGTFDDDGGSGLNSLLYFEAETQGDYFIDVRSYSASNLGQYNVQVEAITLSDDASDTQATTANAQVGTPYQGTVNYAHDDDWIKVELDADKTYNFNLTGLTLSDTMINGIYDDEGRYISGTYNDDSNYSLNSFVQFTVNDAGIYFVDVGGYSSNTGTYQLDISVQNDSNVTLDSESNDTNNTIETAITSNNIGSYESGLLEYAGDEDFYQFSLEAGQTYDIGIYGSETDHGTLVDPSLLGLYDANGNLIEGTIDDNSGTGSNALIRYEATESGEYYVKAGSNDELTGSFQVKVNEVATDVEVTTNASRDVDWTIMVYIAGDNNLEAMGIDDINEMEAINLPDNINVTFLFDRADGYSTAEGDWTGTKRGIISHDNDMYSIGSTMEDIGEQNTGDGDTLTEFINWSSQTANAQNQALVIWNHGGGIDGVAWDESSNYDNLSIAETTRAIDDSNVDNFEMIGFDACLQGVIDQSYAVKDIADIVVSSEDLEPGDGWDYEGWFDKIATDSDGVTSQEMATYVVDSYGEFYQHYSATTLSAVDTTQLDALSNAFLTFNDSLTTMNDAQKNQFKSEAQNVQTFGSYNEYMDLGDLAQMVDDMYDDSTSNDMQTAAKNLEVAINDAVIDETSNDSDPTGISIYYPGYTDRDYIDTFEIAQDTHIEKLYDVLNS